MKLYRQLQNVIIITVSNIAVSLACFRIPVESANIYIFCFIMLEYVLYEKYIFPQLVEAFPASGHYPKDSITWRYRKPVSFSPLH